MILALWVMVYPTLMALLWMGLASLFVWRRERPDRWRDVPAEGCSPLPVSILIPCFNEGPLLEATLQAALAVAWPDFEVIAINDGSCDNTGSTLNGLAEQDSRLRVVHLASNQGKALALRAGALVAKHEWLICIDADALLDRHAVAWMMRHVLHNPRLGAVTGNPRIRNRSTLLGRIQVGEFSMIIGLIKRAQAMLGGLFCVSGVIGCFRRSALHAVGYWSSECLTEDIALTWSLQRAGWQVLYEPHALVWILMPETWAGLWKQRLRWAEGGLQVLGQNLDLLLRPRQWRLLPLLLEPLLSLVWAYGLGLLLLVQLTQLGQATPWPWGGQPLLQIALLVCVLQFALSFWFDRPYDRGLGRVAFWMIWYPLVFWLVTWLASILAFPRLLLRPRQQRARWMSPDRGRWQS